MQRFEWGYPQVAINETRRLALDQLAPTSPPRTPSKAIHPVHCRCINSRGARRQDILVHVSLQIRQRSARLGRQLANDAQAAVGRRKDRVGCYDIRCAGRRCERSRAEANDGLMQAERGVRVDGSGSAG